MVRCAPKQPRRKKNSYNKRKTDQLHNSTQRSCLAIANSNNFAPLLPSYERSRLAQHPNAADAYIAPGIANYIIGSQSAGTHFTLWFGGIHKDEKLGMEQLAKT